MRARLVDEGRAVRLQGALWGMTFPVESLGAWLAFYRGLAARRSARTGRDYAAAYGDTVAELERVAREVAPEGRGAGVAPEGRGAEVSAHG
jgi:hypothetical protein